MIILAQAGVEAVGGGGIVGAVFVIYKLLERYVLDPRDQKKNGGNGKSVLISEAQMTKLQQEKLSEHHLDQMQQTYRYVGDLKDAIKTLSKDIRDPGTGMIVCLNAIRDGIRELVCEIQKQNELPSDVTVRLNEAESRIKVLESPLRQ